ncbi:MAG: hypothetical protein WBF47_22770 [Xanthobacteraceae bacterium]
MAVVTDIFPNFASALAACGQGYNDGEIADALSTSLAVDRRQFTPEQAINPCRGRRRRRDDRAATYRSRLRRRLWQDRFEVFTTLAEAVAVLGGADLIHASSAIQYCSTHW